MSGPLKKSPGGKSRVFRKEAPLMRRLFPFEPDVLARKSGYTGTLQRCCRSADPARPSRRGCRQDPLPFGRLVCPCADPGPEALHVYGVPRLPPLPAAAFSAAPAVRVHPCVSPRHTPPRPPVSVFCQAAGRRRSADIPKAPTTCGARLPVRPAFSRRGSASFRKKEEKCSFDLFCQGALPI